ncbi:hypothetical protein CO038_03110 [Candidatus Pacearchaeota archaeon CG_4_9_14_0_2_um_filter_39_13]|nr:prepilin peptidase [Candidatus Pacearchaeota archaeon]OIO42141.1 MAG: hypothetical protein AUJ64_04195 [Candidatus Pacearchaeota archaeon CG1_02_39_14]PJC44556.1 MAG: hypothetical protein CO038_03110 [Candidatus Pacearchaeota archaeon CG_4_9_14_0_2_um_filter_39_13]
MEEYYFLFFFGAAWMLFASVNDFKTREVPNWLNFSLIAVALAYRGFYSISAGSSEFFIYGILGVLIFTALGFAFYYGRAFGGGDAKLLFAVGAILPFSRPEDLILVSAVFVFLLFGIGAAWSFAYSIFLMKGNSRKVIRKFADIDNWKKGVMAVSFIFGVVLGIYFEGYLRFSFILLGLAPGLYIYAKIMDEVCMIKMIPAKKLREGDWLYKDARVAGKLIKRSVHGLTNEEIEFLRKHKKSVLIRDGIPFTINFLFALMVFFWIFFLHGAWIFSLF